MPIYMEISVSCSQTLITITQNTYNQQNNNNKCSSICIESVFIQYKYNVKLDFICRRYMPATCPLHAPNAFFCVLRISSLHIFPVLCVEERLEFMLDYVEEGMCLIMLKHYHFTTLKFYSPQSIKCFVCTLYNIRMELIRSRKLLPIIVVLRIKTVSPLTRAHAVEKLKLYQSKQENFHCIGIIFFFKRNSLRVK